MKNRILVLLTVLGILMVAPTTTAQDATASRILNDVSRTYQTYKTIKAGFKVTVNNAQTKSKITQTGILYLKGKRFKITLSDQEIYCDGKTMWTYFKEENEVQITKYDPEAQEINPSEIFTIYNKGFDYKYVGETLSAGKKIQNLELIPKDKNKPYFKVKLNVEKASNKITDMKIMNKNGIHTSYSITTFSSNLPMSETFFKFDPKSKPGVVIIDLSK